MADQNINNMTVVWNAGGTTFAAVKMNVTDTASAAASLLLQFQVGGSDKFKVGKDGSVTAAGALAVTGNSTITGNLTVTGTLTAGGIAGTMTGPGASTDNAIARFNGTTGGTLQNSGVTIDDVNTITTPGVIYGAEFLFTSDTDTGLGTFAANAVSLVAGNSIRATFTLASGNTINGNTTINGTLTVTG